VRNVGPIAAIPEVEELNIGHSIVSQAVFTGIADAVRAMRQAMRRAMTAARV
jgi:pyridoxine 5-phosphate synthase